MKPGILTTEFWMSIISLFGCFVLAIMYIHKGQNIPIWLVGAIVGIVGSYNTSRGFAKGMAPQ